MKTLVAAVLLLSLTACAGIDTLPPRSATAPPAATPPSTTEPTRTGTTKTADLTPEEIVSDRRARLVSVRVRRTPDGLHVVAWWRVGNAEDGAITESDDGFATARYRPWTRAWYAAKRAPARIPPLHGLVQWSADSLARGERAVVGGGDGATLFPFQRIARSIDGGATWRTYDVSGLDRVTAYTSGQVVLPGGRMLALLNQWSDDRNGRPSARPHGLYVSAGDDWSHFAPAVSSFRPNPGLAPRGWPGLESLQASPADGGVIWMTTYDSRVYASTDAARTFREIPAR